MLIFMNKCAAGPDRVLLAHHVYDLPRHVAAPLLQAPQGEWASEGPAAVLAKPDTPRSKITAVPRTPDPTDSSVAAAWGDDEGNNND